MAVGKNKLENIARASKMISEAKQKGCNLVVLPECFNSPYGTSIYFSQFVYIFTYLVYISLFSNSLLILLYFYYIN